MRCIFADTVAAIKALSEEQRAEYEAAFKRQKKYKTLRGYIFAQLYNSDNN